MMIRIILTPIFSVKTGLIKMEITAEDATGAVENARNEMIKTAEENISTSCKCTGAGKKDD